MIQLLELEEHIISDQLSAQYLITRNDTVILRFNAMNAVAAMEFRDLKYPGCEIAIVINESV